MKHYTYSAFKEQTGEAILSFPFITQYDDFQVTVCPASGASGDAKLLVKPQGTPGFEPVYLWDEPVEFDLSEGQQTVQFNASISQLKVDLTAASDAVDIIVGVR